MLLGNFLEDLGLFSRWENYGKSDKKTSLILKVGPAALIIAAHFCIAKLLFRAAAFAKCIFYQLSKNPKEVCK